MADVITRLKVESREYDSKIERARSGLLHMEEACRKVGGTLAVLDKDEKEFVQSLGKMETVSKTAAGRVSELTKAFTDLSVQYNRLTNEEKQGDYGKALQASLNQLKTRIIDAKAELKDVQVEINGSSGVLDSLAGRLGVPADLFTKLGFAAAALAGAMKVATDAFKQDEEMLDDWKATTEAASAVYEGFLNSLNTGDISGFITRISQITSAAREAYQALDQLSTFNAFNQINVQKAQTRFTEAYAGYRTGESTKSDVKAAADVWKNELETRRKYEQEAYLAKIREIAASRGVNADDLMKAFSGSYGDYRTLKAVPIETESVWNSSTRSFEDRRKSVQSDAALLGEALRKLNDTELESLQGLGAQAERTATEIAQIDKQVSRLLNGRDNTPKGKTEVTFAEGSIGAQEQLIANSQKAWKEAADDDSRAKIKAQIEAATAELDRLTGKVKPIEIPVVIEGEGGFTENNVAALRKEIQDAMKGMEIGSGEYIIQAERLTDLNTFQNLLKTAVQNGVQLDPMLLEGIFDRIDANDISLGLNIDDSEWASLVDEINTHLAALNLPPIELNVKTGGVKEVTADVQDMKSAWSAAASAVGSVGSALQQIDDPTAKIAGIVAEAIANVAAGLGQMLAMPQSTAQSWGWIALAASGTATMISTIAAIKSVTSTGKYAEGGIIPGTSFSGDKLTANVNSGELILNRAQQNNIAAQLTAGGARGGSSPSSTPFVTGEMIILGANNHLGRTGQGEIVTTGMLRRAGINL